MKNKLLILGLMILILTVNVIAVLDCGSNPYDMDCKPDNNAVVYMQKPSTVCNQECTMPVSYHFSPDNMPGFAGCNCIDVHNITRAYFQFKNLTIVPEDILFNCIGVYQSDLLTKPISFYRFYNNNWNENTINWNNQPVFCNDVYDSCFSNSTLISEKWDSQTLISGYLYYYSLNLSKHNGYRGLLDSDALNINLMVRWGNISNGGDISLYPYPDGNISDEHGGYFPGYCWIETAGVVNNASIVYVRPLVNGNVQDGVQVTICDIDNLCSTKYTIDSLATFTLDYGNYDVTASYCGSSYVYPFEIAINQNTIYLNPEISAPNCTTIPGNTGSISGYVYWSNLTIVSNAVIRVNGTNNYMTISNFLGIYAISGIAKGNYSIYATYGGITSELEYFTCVGADSINLIMKDTLTPPDGYSYTFINVSAKSSGTALSGANIERWWDCEEYCFQSSDCRNTFCSHTSFENRLTDINGIATYNFLSPHYPVENNFIIYGYKSGYNDDYAVIDVSSDFTQVNLNLDLSGTTEISVQENSNISGVKVKLTPNIGGSQTQYTNATGTAFFTFNAPLSSVIINATKTNYVNYNNVFNFVGTPFFLGFSITNRTQRSFNLFGVLTDNFNNTVSGVTLNLICAGCPNAGHCDNTITLNDGSFSWYNLPYIPQCIIHAQPPDSRYSDRGWYSLFPINPIINQNTYFNFSGLLYNSNTTLPGLVYFNALIKDRVSGIPILSGGYDYTINGTHLDNGYLSNGYVFINNLIPGGNISLTFHIPNYEERTVNYLIGTYGFNTSISLLYIGGSTTTTLNTIPGYTTTTVYGATTTTVYGATTTLTPSLTNITVYQLSNESTSALTNAFNVGMSCIGGFLLFAPIIPALAFIIGLLFIKKVVDSLLH
jgi:hypothetical protein